ncbi:heavy metal-associated isoprenylated plant protein 34-like isoform X2 [Hibiscus syriacus]|uniref:heavy metal-associated isoprenylated plant protein 34-like isoform X2 n=1 Tax=Hibiscus syriacus TaxID=106335 RepID=UPI001920A5AD|nr:heavy metal-associated isoprenylated plant protein 34-like isoform X2 [Hibiscus syriacus]
MNKQDVMKMQTWVLKVNIQCSCDGCKQKIRKLLQKVDGVYSCSINADQGKITVSGNVDPAVLIKKLQKSGKHAQLWGGAQKGGCNNFPNQFKNMNMDVGKGGKDNKSQKGGGGGNNQQKGGQKLVLPQHMQQMMKGFNPPKDQKSVKFHLPEDDGSDDDFDDEFDDEFDDDEEDDEFDDEELGHGHGQMQNKMVAMMGKGNGGPNAMMNGQAMNGKKGGGGVDNGRKGVAIDMPMVMKGMGENNKEGKHGNGGKKGGEKNSKGGKGGDKHGGKKGRGGGGLLGFFKKDKGGKDSSARSKKGKNEWDDDDDDYVNNKGSSHKGKGGHGGGGGGINNGNGAKKGGGKNGDGGWSHLKSGGFQDIDVLNHVKGGGGGGVATGHGHHGHGGGGGGKNMGQMGFDMGQMGNYPMNQMGDFAAVQGLPAPMNNGGGYYQGMGPGNPYNQHQYMAMMTNQQRANGGMYQPMMYAQPYPQPSYGPPPMHPPHSESYAHYFSDENANSCSIM